MPTAAILFDLDGTLLDTLGDIAAAANAALAAEGFPPHPEAAYRLFIGSGVKTLLARALPTESATPQVIARCAAAFEQTYAREWNVRTRPYEGIPELLDALTARRLPLTVLSNKPHAFTTLCVEQQLARWRFAAVLGQREGVPHKPDPTGAREIAQRLGLSPEQFLYLGDSGIDMQTARAAGMRPLGAGWGFRPAAEMLADGAEAVIQRPGELLEWV